MSEDVECRSALGEITPDSCYSRGCRQKPCREQALQTYRDKYNKPGSARELAGRRSKLKQRHWTVERYDEFVAKQSNVCAICGGTQTRGDRDRLSADHDHSNNKPRALLCDRCNLALGQIGDDVTLLHQMIEYLNKWRTLHELEEL